MGCPVPILCGVSRQIVADIVGLLISVVDLVGLVVGGHRHDPLVVRVLGVVDRTDILSPLGGD